MDLLFRLIGIALALSVLLVFLRGVNAPFAVLLSVAFLVLGVGLLLRPLADAIQAFVQFGRRASVQGAYLDIIVRAISVALLVTIGAQLSRDAGEGGVAAVVEFAGRVCLLLLAVPVLTAILNLLAELLP